MKTIKIPKGEFRLLFEKDELTTIITDEMLLSFITEGIYKMANQVPSIKEFKEPLTYEDMYDDTDPNYIKSSQEEI